MTCTIFINFRCVLWPWLGPLVALRPYGGRHICTPWTMWKHVDRSHCGERRRAQANAPAALYSLRLVIDDGGSRD